MNVRTLLLAVISASVCASCGSDAPQQGAAAKPRRDTLAGTADTTKKTSRKGGREVRLPQAPIAAPLAASGGAATAAGTSGAPDAIGGSPIAASIDAEPTAPTPPAAAAEPDLAGVPLAPKEAEWTIYCATLRGDDHIAMAKALKKSLIQKTAMREWYVVNEAGQSRIYYGFYRSIADPADPVESKRAKADRQKIDELVDGAGERPFKACQFVQLSAPDPDSPPEWDIANAPTDRVWTLLIAAYKDHPDRKRAAVESVRDARARGEEAYYFHGDTVSNVFVGAWPDEAVLEEKVDAKDGARAQDPLLVLPPGMKVPGKVRRNGKAIRAVGQQWVPVDETLKQKIAQYPQMGVNGSTLVYKQNGRTRVQGPVITEIPRPAHQLFGAGTNGADDANQGDDRAGDGFAGGDDPDFSRGAGAQEPGQRPAGFGTGGGTGTGSRRLRGIGDR
jgi:hypothetical protein